MRYKFRNKLFALLTVLLCAFSLCSCNAKGSVAASELAKTISNEAVFCETMTEIDDATAGKLLMLNPNDYSELSMYVGTKSTCERVIVIRTSSPDTVNEKLDNYINGLKAEYQTYRPVEAAKIDSAYRQTYKKNTIILTVCSVPESVDTAIKSYLKSR